MATIVIVGGSFGGLTMAYELRRRLGAKSKIVLISNRDQFIFVPSLPWVVMGWRQPAQICFPISDRLHKMGIRFVPAAVEAFDLPGQQVFTSQGEAIKYDFLGIATGGEFDFNLVPGLGPEKGYTQSTVTLPHALSAAAAYRELLSDPGPVLIGATQGASCFGPAYELAFMIDYDLRRRGLRGQVPITFVTSEPFVGHFGIGGLGISRRFIEDEFSDRDIRFISNVSFRESSPSEVQLADGNRLPFRWAMIIPRLMGVKAVSTCPGLANEKGFIPVDAARRHCQHENIYAAGVAVELLPKEATPVPTAPPKTGYMTERMAAVAAHNLAAAIRGRKVLRPYQLEAVCVMDAGNRGFYMAAKPLLPPRNHKVLKRGRWAHLLKVAFERVHLYEMKRGKKLLR